MILVSGLCTGFESASGLSERRINSKNRNRCGTPPLRVSLRSRGGIIGGFWFCEYAIPARSIGMTAFCTQCGSALDASTRYCTNCGFENAADGTQGAAPAVGARGR
jgi:hypothetical protein